MVGLGFRKNLSVPSFLKRAFLILVPKKTSCLGYVNNYVSLLNCRKLGKNIINNTQKSNNLLLGYNQQ